MSLSLSLPLLLSFLTILLLYLLFPTLITPLIKPTLTHIPGPPLSLLTPLPLIAHEFSRTRRAHIHRLHARHGPVVRLGPNEVSFTGLGAVREIYASGGSGYDKTGLYGLFVQFGTRTMFSTLGRGDVSSFFIPLNFLWFNLFF